MKPDTIRELEEIQRLGARAVRRAREENRRLGIPNVSVRDGMIVEEMPDGTVNVVGPPRSLLVRAVKSPFDGPEADHSLGRSRGPRE